MITPSNPSTITFPPGSGIGDTQVSQLDDGGAFAAVNHIPSVLGLAKLAALQIAGEDLRQTYGSLASTVSADESTVAPLMDIAILDQLLGNTPRGLTIQSAALGTQQLFKLSSSGNRARLRLLGFATAGPLNANIPVEFLIEDSDVDLYVLYVGPGMPLPAIPDHDVAMVLAAESDAARPVINSLGKLLRSWPRPMIDRPERVPLLGRENLYRLIGDVDGIEIPPTVRAGCDVVHDLSTGACGIESILHGGVFPIIIRPIDSHGGHGLEKIDAPENLCDYLERCDAREYFLSPYVDYRSADGQFRKYRISMIDGVPYASHLAISDNWMIHYLNSGMENSSAKRAEEELFMDRFRIDFAFRHGKALGEIARRSGLEYFGVDCGESRNGKLLIFEADTSLIVHNMDSPATFPYKAAHMRELFGAFRAMLYRKAGIPA